VRRLPWAIFGLATAMSLAGIVLLAQVPQGAIEAAETSLELSAAFATVLVVFGLVGAIVASRKPSSPIGWLFLALAALDGAFELSFSWAHHALSVDPGGLPGGEYAAWVASWTSATPPTILACVLLLFPDGRPPSPRWRMLLWAGAGTLAAVLGRTALAPGPLGEVPAYDNPLGLEGAAWLGSLPAFQATLVLVLAAVASLIVRFRRSRGSRRQQLKWLAWSAALIAAFLVIGGIAETVQGAGGSSELVWGFVFAACISGIPVSAGIAILRHRLYDIDVVINRTLVYGALTATLAGAYLASVLLLQLALSPVTQDSGLAIAGSTLAVAALFGPARARIQAAVDRRFYRSRYDAARTLEAFAGRLRDEVDLEAVSADLRRVAGHTLQPAHVSLWLRSES
jgi:hypothetical protein